MRAPTGAAIVAAMALLATEAGAVANSLYADGRLVAASWLRQPGDLYSGVAYLVGPVRTDANGKQTQYLCTGTLITPTAILTAAHCADAIGTAYFVEDTSSNYVGSFVGISMKAFYAHPSYSGNVPNHDVAVAILKSPAPAWARISKIWTPPGTTNKPYSGTVFLGGYGMTRNWTTGAAASSPRRQMSGLVDGYAASKQMPYLHVGSNRISHPSSATAASISGKSDFDRWYPDRAGLLRNSFGNEDDGNGFVYATQNSPYGFTQRLVDGKLVYIGGGPVWPPNVIEANAGPGDSGSSVFFNPKALVEWVLWHTSYDDMVALGGVPDDNLLAFLKKSYQDDTNYIVGVLSAGWIQAGLSCGDSACWLNTALASKGGNDYALVYPFLPWIQGVLGSNGAGAAAASTADGVGAGGTSYEPFPITQFALEPDVVDDTTDLAGGLPKLTAFTLTTSSVAGCRTAYGNVKLSGPAPAAGLSVTLFDSLNAATIPQTVGFPAGSSSRNFTIETNAVLAAESGAITATFAGTSFKRELTVRPMSVSTLGFSPSSVVGGKTATGKLSLDCAAGPGPVTVSLSSNAPALANPVAANIVVPQGVQTANFDVATALVTTSSSANITATANGASKSKTLKVIPAASVSPTSLKFGNQTVGTTSAELSTTVNNKGVVAVAINGISLSGTYASWFSQASNCPSSLAAGASCTISVRFTPGAASSRSAKLQISTSATATPLNVSLSGTGVLP